MLLKPTAMRLRLATSAMVIAAVAAIALSLLPLGTTPFVISKTIASPSSLPATTQSADSELDFSSLVEVNLRKPLSDANPTTSVRAVANAVLPLGLRLTGTIVEPMHCYALFADAAGKTEIKTIGDTAGGARISAIGQDSVTLQLSGRSMVLHAVKPTPVEGLGL